MLQQDFLSKNDVGLGWLRSDTDLFEAPSKSYSSWTKEPYLFVQESKLNELIDERVSQKVNELLEQRASIIFRNITKTGGRYFSYQRLGCCLKPKITDRANRSNNGRLQKAEKG